MKTLKSLVLITICCLSSCSTIYQTSYQLSNVHGANYTKPEDLISGNDTLSIKYSLEGELEITNNSSTSIVIDLANSFYGDNNGMQSLYSNSIISTTESSTRGGSLNLGGIASAFGAPRQITNIAYGTNIGGGITTGTSIQTFQDRYIIIPPKSFRKINDTNYSIGKGLHNGHFDYVISYGIANKPEQLQYIQDAINFRTEIIGTNVMKGLKAQGVVQTRKNEYKTTQWTGGGLFGYIGAWLGGAVVLSLLLMIPSMMH